MKIRNGFVSNSSSSSFIVNFGTKPETKEALMKVMGECSANPFGEFVSSDDVVDFVWSEIKDKNPSGNDIINHLKRNAVDVDCHFSVSEYIFEGIAENIQEHHWKNDEFSKELLIKLINDQINKVFMIDDSNDFITSIVIGDESPYWAAMEHGEIFRNCKSVEQISHH